MRETAMRGARRRLHEFQIQLSERMKAAREDQARRDIRLAAMVGERYYLFDLVEVAEIMVATAVTAVPFTRDWYLGLVSVRGNLVGVVDYMRFCGGDFTPQGPDTRIVVPSSLLPVACGILVTRVIGIVDLVQLELEVVDTPPVVGGGHCYMDSAGHQWLELGFASLLGDQGFLQVAL